MSASPSAWWSATDDEWAAEVARRWLEIDADNQPDFDEAESDLDRLMMEDLRSCQ